MATITVRKTVEVEVDLNAYYPQFPRRLRDEIDAAVLALASGSKREVSATPREGMRKRYVSGDPAQVVVRTNKTPAHGLMRYVAQAIPDQILMSDLRALVARELEGRHRDGSPKAVIQVISSLFKGGYVK